MHGEGDEPTPSNPGGPVPATDDEIREKYLERAIREMNALTHDVQGCRHCPRGNLMPVLGSGHPQADVFLLKYAPVVSEIEEGIAFANDSEFGLSGAVWAADIPEAVRIARRLRTGQVAINGGRFNARAPFGGFKASGVGREIGHHGLLEYFELQSMQFP